MTDPQQPTISATWDQAEDGSYTASVRVSGISSEEQAKADLQRMRDALSEQQQALRDLIDPTDGENRAVRCFLMLYGSAGPESYTIGKMQRHLERCGYPFWPDLVPGKDALHLTKGGAQSWLRHLFSLEAASAPSMEVPALPNPGSPEASSMIDSMLAKYHWPANPKNAARAGYEAARCMLSSPSVAAEETKGSAE